MRTATAEQTDRRDRRAALRRTARIVCEERRSTERHFGLTHDLSPFGLATQSSRPYQNGEWLSLLLHLPDGIREPVGLAAKVVGANQTSGGVRLAFRSPSSAAVRRIQRYLARLSEVTARSTEGASQIPVELHEERGFSLQLFRQLRAGEAVFEHPVPFPIGFRLTARFGLPDGGAPVECEGEVVNLPDAASLGTGLRFHHLAPADRARIEAFVRRGEPKP
jgi:hypothetical protein